MFVNGDLPVEHLPAHQVAKAVVLKDDGGYVVSVLPANHSLEIGWVNEQLDALQTQIATAGRERAAADGKAADMTYVLGRFRRLDYDSEKSVFDEAFDVADRLGSVEIGKDADLLAVTGDPSDPRSAVEKVWIEGRLVYDVEQEALLERAQINIRQLESQLRRQKELASSSLVSEFELEQTEANRDLAVSDANIIEVRNSSCGQ